MKRKDFCACISKADSEGLYFFREPEATLTGGAEDWGMLEEVLRSRGQDKRDYSDPPGGMVGYFSYEGDFQFHICPYIEKVSYDVLDPESVKAPTQRVESLWRENVNQAGYVEMVKAAQEWIRAGDIYQVNLARQYSLECPDLDCREFFKHLWQGTRAPRSAFVAFEDRTLMSASPELFLEIQGRRIVTQPIKGTRPRDRDPIRDEQNALELSTDPKEVAELVMITDLERNDLGKICDYGTVVARDLVRRETFSHVFHLLSTVEGYLRQGVGVVSAVRACFPGGSITGAPKKRAMEVIAELEPVKRGFYTGAIGYFGFDGSAHFNIAIRTAEYAKGELRFFVGSGITAGSDPVAEFQETRHKAAALEQAYRRYAANMPRKVVT